MWLLSEGEQLSPHVVPSRGFSSMAVSGQPDFLSGNSGIPRQVSLSKVTEIS